MEEILLKSSIDKLEQTQKTLWNKGQSMGKQYQAYLDSSEKVKKLKTSLKEEERKPFLLRNRRKIKEDTHSLEQLEKERRQQIYLFKETFGISPVNNPDGKRKKQQEYKQVYLSNQRRLKDLKQESFGKKAFQTDKPNDPMSRKKSIVGQLEAFKEKERFMPETISQEDYERAIKRLQDYEPDKATALRNIFLNTNIQEKRDLSQYR